MENWKILLIILGTVLLIVKIWEIKKKRKEKDWLLFEETKGFGDNIQKRKFALNRITGEKKYY